MPVGITKDSELTPGAVEGRLAKHMLKVAIPRLILEDSIEVTEDQPEKSTRVVRWGKYDALPISTVTVDEGITPPAVKLVRTEISASLDNYAGLIETTNVVHLFHPDFTIDRAQQRLAEQAATTIETVRFNTFKAGTQKKYTNGTARSDVNEALSIGDLDWAQRALDRKLAETFTEKIDSTSDFNMESILPSYWGYVHTDAEYIIKSLPGFKGVEDYGHNMKAVSGEFGNRGKVRFRSSTICVPYADAGGDKLTMISTGGTKADVYPLLIVGRQAWGAVAFRGRRAINPFVVVPSHTVADPIGQKGFIGWDAWTKAKILNDDWFVVIEMAVPELS